MANGRLPEDVRGISLDLGNTIYPLRAGETALTIRRLHEFLERRLGRPLPFDTLHGLYLEIRERQFTENRPTLRENDFDQRLREMIAHVHAPPDETLVREASDAYGRAFVETLRLPAGVRDVVMGLVERYEGRVVVCSNFILSWPIREVLLRDGILPFLKGVVVSCDLGYVKPHQVLFQAVSRLLDLPPARIAHVGDDLDADIYGGRRAGMVTVYTTEFCETASPDEIDAAQPDLIIERLADLGQAA